MNFLSNNWFSIITAFGVVGTIVYEVIGFVKGKKSTVAENRHLLIDTESIYLEKITSFRTEIAELTQRIASIETKLALREKEVLHLESRRISALLRIAELEKENEILRSQQCDMQNCTIRRQSV